MISDEIFTAWDGHIFMSIEPAEIVIEVEGTEVARTRLAIRFAEGGREPVFYVPKADALIDRYFQPTGHRTTCRWKGDASYFSVIIGGKTHENIVWSYPEAFEEVAPIRDHIAFDTTNAAVTLRFEPLRLARFP